MKAFFWQFVTPFLIYVGTVIVLVDGGAPAWTGLALAPLCIVEWGIGYWQGRS